MSSDRKVKLPKLPPLSTGSADRGSIIHDPNKPSLFSKFSDLHPSPEHLGKKADKPPRLFVETAVAAEDKVEKSPFTPRVKKQGPGEKKAAASEMKAPGEAPKTPRPPKSLSPEPQNSISPSRPEGRAPRALRSIPSPPHARVVPDAPVSERGPSLPAKSGVTFAPPAPEPAAPVTRPPTAARPATAARPVTAARPATAARLAAAARPAAAAVSQAELKAQPPESARPRPPKRGSVVTMKLTQELALTAELTYLTPLEEKFCHEAKLSEEVALALKAIKPRDPPMSLQDAFLLAEKNEVKPAVILEWKKIGFPLEDAILCRNNNICFSAYLECKANHFPLEDAIRCKDNGMMLRDALIYRKIASEDKCNIEFRGGSPIPWMGETVARKPYVIKKEKSDKSGEFTDGSITVAEPKTAEDKQYYLKRLRENQIYQDLPRISLAKILTLRDKSGKLRYTYDPEYSDPATGRLSFRLSSSTSEPPVICSINLDDYKHLLKQDKSMWCENWPAGADGKILPTFRPEWWPAHFDFNKAMNTQYPVQKYDHVLEAFVRAEKIYITKDPQGNSIPISTDNDANGYSCSTKDLSTMTEEERQSLVGTRINTSSDEGPGLLIEARVSLENWRRRQAGEKPLSVLEEAKLFEKISSERIFDRETGYITALGSEKMSRINGEAVTPGEYMFRPLQHSDEDNNIGFSQELKSTILFGPDGKVVVCPDLESLVRFRISVVHEQFYIVNENAKKFEAWVPLVAAQLNYRDSKGNALPVMEAVKLKFVECICGPKCPPLDKSIITACASLVKDPAFQPSIPPAQRTKLENLASSLEVKDDEAKKATLFVRRR